LHLLTSSLTEPKKKVGRGLTSTLSFRRNRSTGCTPSECPSTTPTKRQYMQGHALFHADRTTT